MFKRYKHTYGRCDSSSTRGGIHILGIVLAAGRGERLLPLTDVLPKALVHVAGKSLLQWSIEHLQGVEVDEIIVATGWKSHMVEEFVNGLSDENVRVVPVSEYEQGPLHTLVGALDAKTSEDFIVTPVDAWLTLEDLRGIIKSTECDLCLATDYSKTTGTPVFSRNSSILTGLGTEIGSYTEKGASAMVFRAGRSFVDAAKQAKDEGLSHVLPVINRMIENELHIRTYPVKNSWFDLDELQDVLAANRHILAEGVIQYDGVFIPSGDVIECGDGVVIASGTKAEHGAILQGPLLISEGCTIGKDSIIGPNVTLDVHTTIGSNCRIQDTIAFGRSTLAPNTTISNSILFESTIYGGQ